MEISETISHIERVIRSKNELTQESISRSVGELVKNYSHLIGKDSVTDFVAQEFGIVTTEIKHTSPGFKLNNTFYCYRSGNKLPLDIPCLSSMSFARIKEQPKDKSSDAFQREFCLFLLQEAKIITESFIDEESAFCKIGDVISNSFPMASIATYTPEGKAYAKKTSVILDLIEKEKAAISSKRPDELIILSGPTIKGLFTDNERVKVLSATDMPKLLQTVNFMKNHDEILSNLKFISIKVFLPRLCKHCKVAKKQPSFSALHVAFSINSGDYFTRGPGCRQCYDGYDGILPLEEVIDKENFPEFLSAASDFLSEREASKKNSIFHIYSCLQNKSLGSIYKNAAHYIREGSLSPKDVINFFF